MVTLAEYSIGMSLVDFVPVTFFLLASIFILRDLYNKMSKGAYALLSGGLIDVFLAGFLKALYKLLYAAKICDFVPLTKMFFPVEAIGFLLAGISMIALMFFPQGKGKIYSVFPLTLLPLLAEDVTVPEFQGTMIFVVVMCLGLGFLDAGFIYICVKMNKKKVIVLFAISFVFSLAMGYLSSKNFEQAYWNWIAEAINSIGQGSLFAGALLLHKDGLGDFSLVTKGTLKEEKKLQKNK